MNVSFRGQSAQDAPLLEAFGNAVREDLCALATLHDREIDAATLAELKRRDFPASIGLRLRSEEGRRAAELMYDAVAGLPEILNAGGVDALAVDFADIYLTYMLRAAPTESPWLDPDHLERQEPMFAVRAYYRRRGLKVLDWSKRPDDHLVTQLLFLAHLFMSPDMTALREAACFLDEHLRRWIGRFAVRVAQRCGTPFYAGLALVTAAYVEELRDLVSSVLGEPAPSRAVLEALSDRPRLDPGRAGKRIAISQRKQNRAGQ
jgi:TorA maturation chaperone TorD